MVPANFSINFLLARFQPLRWTMDSVFESNAIAYYVSKEELRGSIPEAAAQVVQWVSLADSDIVPAASTWVFPTLGIMRHGECKGGELAQTFMSFNLMTAVFQRLDKLGKNASVSVILFGTNNSGPISGVWVFRGQELAFPLSPDWQSPSLRNKLFFDQTLSFAISPKVTARFLKYDVFPIFGTDFAGHFHNASMFNILLPNSTIFKIGIKTIF
ncbi:hypothetical protein E2I00_008273 [Balaenoptera physalus]|uniref:EF-1-gamma C-terminal domain-containing protein n=1 Tax=Balaenoptera physalus TaxID=9770 RepID=A0A643C8D7_BALPH|nr:hypothetical protein E2I00_008273 [Balaenoptera physalus]